MTHRSCGRMAVSGLALGVALTAAGTAQAAVTAQEVWDAWKANLGLYGEGVSIGSETLDGGVLVVTDLAVNVPSEEGSVTGTLAEIVLAEQGDGTVVITLSEEFPLSVDFTDADTGEAVSMALALRQQGLEMVVSGDPAEMIYSVTAGRYGLDLDSLTVDGVEQAVAASIGLNDLAGIYAVAAADLQAISYEMAASSLDILFDVNVPEEDVVFNFSGTVADFAARSDMTLPLEMTPDATLADGVAMAGGYSFGAVNYLFSATTAGMPAEGSLTASGGSLDFAIDSLALSYVSSSNDIALQASSAMMPLPVNITLAQYGLGLTMPLSPTEAPAPFGLTVNLTDLAVNEELWAMVDPAGMLPHDPATLVARLSGTGTMYFDITDPEVQASMGPDAIPGEINSISLDELNVAIAGAQITGAGAFTLDNTDLTTVPGMPKPVGKLDLALNGVNGLMDTLVQMGLLPAEQIMGAQMMLGMFAVPVGDDQLTTTIEATEAGQILANGQPLN